MVRVGDVIEIQLKKTKRAKAAKMYGKVEYVGPKFYVVNFGKYRESFMHGENPVFGGTG